MFSKIISTIGTRFGLALISLALTFFTAKFFGASGTGEVRLLMLNIAIIVLFTSFLGGPNLVYLVPRTNLFGLVFNAYWGAIAASGAVTLVLWALDQTYSTGALNLFLLGSMQAITVVHHMVLVGKEDIRQYNIVSMLHGVLIISAFLFNMFVLDNLRVDAYVQALYIASGISLLYSIPVTWKYITIEPLKNLGALVMKALRYGFFTQVGNIAQMLNYRLSYYLLEALTANGLAQVGVYSVAVQFSEGLWIVQRAIGVVQYSRIANTSDREYAVRLTLSLIKVSALVALLMLVPLLLIPGSIYKAFLGGDFEPIQMTILTLSPGILAFSVSGMLSGFFAGVGKHHINTVSSVTGLVITLGIGLWLIPIYGLKGAGFTASLSYCLSTIVQLFWFFHTENARPAQLLPNRADVTELRNIVQEYLQKRSS